MPSIWPDALHNLSLRRRRTQTSTSSRPSSYISYSVYQQVMSSIAILRDPDATTKLLETILDMPGGRRSLSRFARTCKSICEPALDVLWRELDSIIPLVSLFPNSILKRARRPGLGFSKPPVDDDWQKVLAYGERVRRIAYDENSNSIASPILPTLDQRRPRTYILPNLTTLIYKAETPAGLDRCLMFLCPSVQNLTLDIGLIKTATVLEFFKKLSNRTRLTALSLTLHSQLPDEFTDVLAPLSGLEKIALSAPGALSSKVGKWVTSLPKLQSLQLDLSGREMMAVEGFFDDMGAESGYSTPSSVGGTDSGVFSAEEPDFSDHRKSALKLTGDAPRKGACAQLKQLHLTGEPHNIVTFMKHLACDLAHLELVIDDPVDKQDWRDLSVVLCDQFGHSLQTLKVSATAASRFSELARSANRDVPLKRLSLEHFTLLPNLYRLEFDLPESVLFTDADLAHLSQVCPNVELLRLCPLARFVVSAPGLSLESIAPLTTNCRRLHTLALVINAHHRGSYEEVLESREASSRSLLRLHVGHSWIDESLHTSILLSHLAPHLEILKWFHEKNRTVVEVNAQGWQTVNDYLPHLQKLRLQERRAGAAFQEKAIDSEPQIIHIPPPPPPEKSDKVIDATPVLIDEGVLAKPRVINSTVQASPQMQAVAVEAKPEIMSISIDATPILVDAQILVSPSLSDAAVDACPATASTPVDATAAVKEKSVEAAVSENGADGMSDTAFSSSSSSSDESHRPFIVPSISGMFYAAREVFFNYPLYLSLRLINISLSALGARGGANGGEVAEYGSEKRVPPGTLFISRPPTPAATDAASPGPDNAISSSNEERGSDVERTAHQSNQERPPETVLDLTIDSSKISWCSNQKEVKVALPSSNSACKGSGNGDISPLFFLRGAMGAELSYQIGQEGDGTGTRKPTRHFTDALSARTTFATTSTYPSYIMAEPKKQEKDFTAEVDSLLPETQSLASAGKLQDALDKLFALEKQTRNASDLQSTIRLVKAICELCYTSRDYALLNSSINTLSKKHGQLKAAVQAIVELAMSWLEEIRQREGTERWLELVETLRTVTEGKIYLETPRARVTLLLAHYHENLSKNPTPTSPSPKESLQTASDLLSDLQVETYSSMERKEKTEFILEQMRLLIVVAREKDAEVDKDKKESLAGGDAEWVKVRVGGRKVNEEFLKEKENEELKLKYYDLMIQHALHNNAYLDVAKYYYKVWETPSIKEDENVKGKAALEHIVYYIILAPHDNEQSDMLHHLFVDPALAKLELHYNLVKHFTTQELMRWPGIESIYGPFLRETSVFSLDKRWEDLHTRVIEHNIRVVAMYYTRITLPRLTSLLDLTQQQTEETLCRLVVDGTIWARIDRPTGVINFRAKRQAEDVMNDWSSDMQKLLGLVEKAWMGMNAAQAAQSRVKAS